MIRRVLCAILSAGAMTLSQASGAAWASGSITAVTWHGHGLVTWERVERRSIEPQTLHRFSSGLSPGTSKIIAHGTPGVLEVRMRLTQRDGGPVHRNVLWSSVVRAPRPRVVADGVGHSPLADFEVHGLARMAFMARGALAMIATAYSADCAGCDGMTAIGRRAGRGIVAVDPRLIPLGTRLYIPGYGPAIAGDTGGDIVGHRIDLGFDSPREAMLFGRRAITVYRIK